MSSSDAGGTLRDIAVRDPRISAAIDEPMRAMILDILADESHTAGEVHEALVARGIDRTENTVRHHINELRDAGLVEVVEFEEGRGGTTKYYGANTILLSYSLPEDESMDAMVETVRPHIEAAIEDLQESHTEDIDALVSQMSPCEHCENQKYETYVALSVLRRAFVSAYHDSE